MEDKHPPTQVDKGVSHSSSETETSHSLTQKMKTLSTEDASSEMMTETDTQEQANEQENEHEPTGKALSTTSSTTGTEGDGPSSTQKDDTSNATVPKEPSATKVAFLFRLPSDTNYPELNALAEAFGGCRRIHFLKMKRQAFVEFHNETTCSHFIVNVNDGHVQMRGKKFGAAPSKRTQVTLPDESQRKPMEADNNPPSCVLLVTVLHCVYPVNVDVLQQVRLFASRCCVNILWQYFLPDRHENAGIWTIWRIAQDHHFFKK